MEHPVAMSALIRTRRVMRAMATLTAFVIESGPPSASAEPDTIGRYSILRENDKDTGCMLTLRAGAKAQLAPACRDHGVVIFDPVGWRLEHGRLILTARRGHKAHFEKAEDGVWRRDSSEGRELGLRPI